MDFITYINENGYEVRTNMYTMEEALKKVEYAKKRKLNTPVDKRTRFYKYLVDQGIVIDGQTIYNRDVINIK